VRKGGESGNHYGDATRARSAMRQMIRKAFPTFTPEPEAAGDRHATRRPFAPAPLGSVHPFCDTVKTAAAIQWPAGPAPRKAHFKIMGGVTAAIEKKAYRGRQLQLSILEPKAAADSNPDRPVRSPSMRCDPVQGHRPHQRRLL